MIHYFLILDTCKGINLYKLKPSLICIEDPLPPQVAMLRTYPNMNLAVERDVKPNFDLICTY